MTAQQQPSMTAQPKAQTTPVTAGGTTSLTRIGAGLVSCFQVPELQHPTAAHTLRSVCLHANNLTRMEGLEHLSSLQELNLSSNAVTQIEGLQGLSRLVTLNLASNQLTGGAA